MTSTSHTEDASFVIQSRMTEGAPGGRRTFATITCRTCGKTDDTPLKDKNAGWARRVFKSRGWSVADRPGRHQCPTCAQGPRGLGGKSVREAILKVNTEAIPSYKRQDLFGASSLDRAGTGSLTGPNGAPALQEIDPDLLKTDRMAEALSHLGHVTVHVEAPSVPEPEQPSTPKRQPRGKGPREVPFKASGRPGSLPVSPKPADLPEFLIPPLPAKQYKRKLRGYRYPGDAAYTARAYMKACGVSDPQVGRDFIVWAADGEIGWAPAPRSLPARKAALEHVLADAQPLLAEGTIPAPTPTVAVEPTPEEPMTQPTIAVVPPPQPTRDKLLAIHEKLNAVYLTEGDGRYTGMWSDTKVAAELDVPPAWVAAERGRVYGTGTGNESDNIALDKWRRDMTNRMAKATARQAKAIEELLAVNTEIEAIQAAMSTGPKEG